LIVSTVNLYQIIMGHHAMFSESLLFYNYFVFRLFLKHILMTEYLLNKNELFYLLKLTKNC